MRPSKFVRDSRKGGNAGSEPPRLQGAKEERQGSRFSLRGFLSAAGGRHSLGVKLGALASWRFVFGFWLACQFATGAIAEITPANVANLKPAWSTELKGGSRATVVSDGTALFIPNSNGYLYKIEPKTGAVIWEIALADRLGIPGASASKGVAVTDSAVIFGLHNTPVVVALDKNTGAVLWKATIDDYKGAVITQTPTVAGGRVYVGVSGLGEEVSATTPPYACCGFRGSMQALDAATGRSLWKTYTMPEHFAGGAVWSSYPLLDAKRHTLFVTTGNAFRVPSEVQSCIEAAKGDAGKQRGCYPKGVWYDSILALDPDTGAIKWGFRAEDADVFTGACLVKIGGYCGGGEDYDFGNGALEWHAGAKDFVGAGQKAGVFWALDPDSGKLAWKTKVGPGGPTGGIEYGSAVDGTRVYVSEGNTKQVGHDAGTYTLPDGQTIDYGSYAALDAATGKIAWQVPDPAGAKGIDNGKPCTRDGPRENCAGAFPKGAVTVVNGVVYGCSTAPTGPLYAFDAATGKLLWSFDGGASCDTRATVVGDAVYWAAGKTLYGFTLDAGPMRVNAQAVTGRSTRDGVYSAAQAEAGRALYAKSCATGCHGANLAGAGPTPSLAGKDFLARWSGLSVGELYRRVRTTMPKNAPGSLSDKAYLDVVAYLLSANGFPAGKDGLGDMDGSAIAPAFTPTQPSPLEGEGSKPHPPP
jgi:polyvinyl alcohol dehydrogenase (cytochrome)